MAAAGSTSRQPGPARRPAVAFRAVSHRYFTPAGEVQALERLSLTVWPGEFVAVVGPSGCGKSTLLSLAAGLVRPTSGEVLVDGRPVQGPSRGVVGYMPQRDALFEWRDVLGNVLVGPDVQGRPRRAAAARARTLLARYGLASFETHFPHELSGGMRQRVALIRTLAVEPAILLLDEPFSALDFQTRLALADEVSAILRQEGKTAILVTHDIGEAISMADRVVVLTRRPGRVKAEHPIRFPGGGAGRLTPFAARQTPEFSRYFQQVWEDLELHTPASSAVPRADTSGGRRVQAGPYRPGRSPFHGARLTVTRTARSRLRHLPGAPGIAKCRDGTRFLLGRIWNTMPPSPLAEPGAGTEPLPAAPSPAYQAYLRQERARRLAALAGQFALLALFLVTWEVAAAREWVNPFLTSRPSAVGEALVRLAREGVLFHHTWATLRATGVGFAAGMAIGLGLAAALWWWPYLAHVLDPYLVVVNALPKIALAPLFYLWLGDRASVYAMAVAISVIVTATMLYTGFREVDTDKVKVVQTFGATRGQVFTRVVLPASLPTLVATVKVNIALTLVGVIVGEFQAARAGLGYLILYSGQVFQTDVVMAALAVLALISAGLYLAVHALEARLLRGRP